MRNDILDEPDHVPSLTPDLRDQDEFATESPAARSVSGNAAAEPRGAGTGPLWALLAAFGIALGAVSWWSFQQVSLMGQQLIATQENFARISEEASGRIQDISGKVVASESTVLSGNESIKLQIRQLEKQSAELGKQLQRLTAQQEAQGKQVEQLANGQNSQQEAAGKYQQALTLLAAEHGKVQSRLDGLEHGQTAQKTALADNSAQLDKLGALQGDVQALKKIGNPNQSIKRLEQDLLVLRSELDNRPASSGNSTAEFDAFRAQTSRSINSLQSQIQSLQQQIKAN